MIELLQGAGIAEVAGEPLDIESLAGDSGESVPSVRSAIEQLDRMGLVYSGLDEGCPPMLLNAGRQYLTQRGLVTREVLYFLPSVIDDLHARDALIHAGVILVDEFRYQLLHGDAVEHAAELVPPRIRSSRRPSAGAQPLCRGGGLDDQIGGGKSCGVRG